MGRRAMLGASALAAAAPVARASAQGAGGAIRIGALTDVSDPYRDVEGPAGTACVRQAVAEFAAENPDIAVEVVSADHQNEPDVASAIVREWFDRGGVDAIVQVGNTAVALKLRSARYDRAKQLREKLKADIAELTARAEAADAEAHPVPRALPTEIARREALKAKLDAACARLEEQARAEAAAARPEYEAKRAAYDAKTGRRGRAPKPPEDDPPPARQSNLTDPDSALMRRSDAHEYRQAYNAQAVACAEGSQLILASAGVVASPADAPSFTATILGMGRGSACPPSSSPTPASPPARRLPPSQRGGLSRSSPSAAPSRTAPAISGPRPSLRSRAASPSPGASPRRKSSKPPMRRPVTPAASRPV